MKVRTSGKRRSFIFSRKLDEVLEDQCAATGTTLTEALRRGVFLREQVRRAGEPSILHPKGERLCFEDIATGELRPIEWI